MNAVKYSKYFAAADEDCLIVIDSETLKVDYFSLMTTIRELYATPAGIVAQCDEDGFVVAGEPRPYVQRLFPGRYEDIEMIFDKDGLVTGLTSRNREICIQKGTR